MAKINFKLDKQFLSELTGSLSKDALKDNKKLLSLFDIINVRKKDDTIDVKEIADFAYSIFEADTNNDGEVDNKELKTFINTPVFIINSGFALVLFLALVVILVFKLDSLSVLLEKSNFEISLSKDIIMNNLSIVILVLIIFTSFMTSITNSVISLEGRNINILKSLPVKVKTILMSKVYACLLITTPVLLIGDIVLFIKCKTNIIEALLLVILSILMPLVSHFLGIIINLKYPKLDAENTAEVVKQSTSSFIAVMLGMFILMMTIGISIAMATMLPTVIVLLILTIVFGLIDLILYLILKTVGVKNFNKLSI